MTRCSSRRSSSARRYGASRTSVASAASSYYGGLLVDRLGREPGVERVEEEVRQLFPEARTAVFSSDTAPDARSVATFMLRSLR